MSSRAYLLDAGLVPYDEALDLQRAIAAAVIAGTSPDTVVLLEHPPVITMGRRTEQDKELHVPDGAHVEIVETNRGGKSTYHAPGQLVCYPILDLNRHGKDVKKYVRDLERAIIATIAAAGSRRRRTRVSPESGCHRPAHAARGRSLRSASGSPAG